ncbi:recombination protein NinB [Bradyrhizobium retamae]|uniref:NinB family protein n=1 Tax=Bradyrhizobium retamae TaxID=1300035 RepID=A0A0R3MNT3_9BRAD|nr:recombination protein NinB [Bradyrhizobium retamae]KRR21874.1 NinB family protein [Bradyrhizobium retamae]
MTGRAVITLNNNEEKTRARFWIEKAPRGTRVEFKGPQRTIEQNSRMWAMLTDIATQKKHAGRKYTTDQWKVLFMHACGREVAFLPSLDGSTFIPWGQSSSDLSTEEMNDLIEFMFAWGCENNVVWSDPKEVALRELERRAG